MTLQAEDKRKLKFGAVWLWCIGKGYEEKENEESFLDAAFSEGEKSIGFVFEFDKTTGELISCIENAKEKVQYIYIVIDDDSKYQRLKKLVPEFCGVFCNSNAFGLGMVTQIKRQATILSKGSENNERENLC